MDLVPRDGFVTASGAGGLRPRPAGRARGWLRVYCIAIVLAALAAFAYGIKTNSIFRCPAVTDDGSYLAYCTAPRYADYEHGAIYFGLEPGVVENLRAADVVFVGNSRTQMAFSSAATARWFSGSSLRYYLLGFGYDEGAVFEDALLKHLRLRPKVLIINADAFFNSHMSPPARTVLLDKGGRAVYREKRLWGIVDRNLCALARTLCETDVGPSRMRSGLAISRSRATGAWHMMIVDTDADGPPVDYETPVDERAHQEELAIARSFLAGLAVRRECIVITVVPWAKTPLEDGRALASDLGLSFVSPRIAGLRTFDGSHLNNRSASAWSGAMLEAARPIMERCAAGG